MNHLGGGYFKFWRRWQQKGTMSMAITLCCAPKRKPPRKLRDQTCFSNCGFRVQPHAIMALAQSITLGRPIHCLQLLDMGIWNASWGLKTKLAMMYGRTFWKDFVTFSICQYSILVSTNPVGHWWQQDGIVSCG